jgi:hypothetical protein
MQSGRISKPLILDLSGQLFLDSDIPDLKKIYWSIIFSEND